MRRMIGTILATVCLSVVTTQVFSQITASITEGCSPLEVIFTAEDGLSAYFWRFGEGAPSIQQNPEKLFTNPGIFEVILFEGENGPPVDTVVITVYPDPIIEVEAKPSSGCTPLEVEFTSDITIDDSVEIVSYLWSFGDGESSNQPNPIHTYNLAGVFTVSLELTTSIGECDKTVEFVDLINVENLVANFAISPSTTCEVPADIEITNSSTMNPATTYFWDFGNGETSTVYDPGTITYTQNGTYQIRLVVTDTSGCESFATRFVTVGPPVFNFQIPDTICLGDTLFVENNTNALFHNWEFPGGTPSLSGLKEPVILYESPGDYTISLNTFTFQSCQSDTTFSFYVQEVDAAFTGFMGPVCAEPIEITFTADNPSYAIYFWNESILGGPTFESEYNCPVRDSFYINYSDTLQQILNVTSTAGCMDADTSFFVIRKPEAYYFPNVAQGCAPLSVSFIDLSVATEEIISWTWIYGDGEESIMTEGGAHSHVYTEPGEYLARLIIETADGCIDTSGGTWIEVGEPITSDYLISDTEICLGDSITIEMQNLDDRIDAWHVTTDNGRFAHCWTGPAATHAFVAEPGTFDVTTTIDYNGCITSTTDEDVITVNGAKADIDYMINCETPNDVMFTSASLNAGTVEWTFSEQDSSFEEMLTYTYDTTGDYIVYLEAVDPDGLCPVSIDSAEIFIRNIEAHFDLPERVCDNFEYILDASQSVDVDNDCSKGYLWYLKNSRPREVDDDSIINYFTVLGPQDVTLIVEDINGCTDTLTRHTTSYGIDPLFTLDRDRICLPGEVMFTDISTADTTLIEWDWSFGGTTPNEKFTFTQTTGPNLIEVQLTVADEVGCRDSLVIPITVYAPTSSISFDNGPNICVGDEVSFTASDFTQEGSFLNFEWDFGFGVPGGSNAQSEKVVFNEPGFPNIILNFEEDSTGCTGSAMVEFQVAGIPIADFTTNVDTVDPICYPQIISFMDNSFYEGPSGSYYLQWTFPNGFVSGSANPVLSFGKGTHTVQLIAGSTHGCADTIERGFTLVGPEGSFTADDTEVCKGGEITFMLRDTADVNSFEWDFGDGTPIVENTNPVTHVFNPTTSDSIFQTAVTLVLKSEETGCETISSIPIEIINIQANFNTTSADTLCFGRFAFENLSSDLATSFQWDFGDGNASTEENPVHFYPNTGTYPVTLIVTDETGGCVDTLVQDIEIMELPEPFYIIPNVFTPNNDDLNDFFNVITKEGNEDLVNVIEFKVYNRWGNLIYDNDSPQQGWDGTYDGEPAPTEVYAYYIELQVRDCPSISKKGNITLVR